MIAVMACKLRACVCGEAKMNTKAGPLEVRASEARWEGRTEGPEKGSFSPLLPDRCCRQPWAQRVTKLQRGLRVIIPPSSGLSSQDHRAWALPASSAWGGQLHPRPCRVASPTLSAGTCPAQGRGSTELPPGGLPAQHSLEMPVLVGHPLPTASPTPGHTGSSGSSSPEPPGWRASPGSCRSQGGRWPGSCLCWVTLRVELWGQGTPTFS